MWWYGRGNSGGSWLLEEKKDNMWPGREIVVAHGRLPSPTHWRRPLTLTDMLQPSMTYCHPTTTSNDHSNISITKHTYTGVVLRL